MPSATYDPSLSHWPQVAAAHNPNQITSNSVIGDLKGDAASARDLSKSIGIQGLDLLGPASDYLKAILSGDRTAVMQATAPERRRVIDQYSAAKKAIAEFTPRGGGQAGSMNALQAQEAGDLSTIGSGARTKAIDTATGTGTQLEGLGLSAKALASGDLGQILQALTAKEGQNAQSAAAFGQGVGQLLPLLLML